MEVCSINFLSQVSVDQSSGLLTLAFKKHTLIHGTMNLIVIVSFSRLHPLFISPRDHRAVHWPAYSTEKPWKKLSWLSIVKLVFIFFHCGWDLSITEYKHFYWNWRSNLNIVIFKSNCCQLVYFQIKASIMICNQWI